MKVGGASTCKCSGVNTGVNTALYGSDYGTSCKAWDDSVTYSANTKSCAEYIDVSDPACNGVVTPFYASFLQEDTNQALYYSYAHCEQTEDVVEETYTAENCTWQGSDDYAPSFVVTATVRDFSDSHPHFGCGGEGCFTFFY